MRAFGDLPAGVAPDFATAVQLADTEAWCSGYRYRVSKRNEFWWAYEPLHEIVPWSR